MNKHKAPLYEQLVKTHFRRQANFHVPGHKGGQGLDPAGMPFFHSIMGIDYTEISDLDDLHHPEGVIREAQLLAADCFGAEETCFLVGGSTVGNLALITTVCQRGDLLIVQRNVHKSVINGLMLAGARAVFLSPRYESRSGLAGCVDPKDIEEALNCYPEAKGVLLTNPNYYGMGLNLTEIAAMVHRRGIPLLVDEAHGAHFGLHPDLPASAMQCGADGVVQSTHKMLGAMTMGAMLHMQGPLIDRDKLRQRLSMLQSSSPSYPIMASLDLSRRLLHQHGKNLMEKALNRLGAFRERLHLAASFQEVRIGSEAEACDYMDPFRLTIYDKTGILTGFELQRALEEYGCTPEMADPRHVLLLASYATAEEELERLLAALLSIEADYGMNASVGAAADAPCLFESYSTNIGLPVQFDMNAVSSSERTAPKALVPMEEAAGYVAAEMIVPYPPGIPLLYAGEEITPQAVKQLVRLAETGARFQGKSNESSQMIQVYTKEQAND